MPWRRAINVAIQFACRADYAQNVHDRIFMLCTGHMHASMGVVVHVYYNAGVLYTGKMKVCTFHWFRDDVIMFRGVQRDVDNRSGELRQGTSAPTCVHTYTHTHTHNEYITIRTLPHKHMIKTTTANEHN